MILTKSGPPLSWQLGPGPTQNARANHNSAQQSGDQVPFGRKFLYRDKTGKGGDPKQIHGAADKQKRHQAPAAPDTIKAMAHSHPPSAEKAIAPVAHQKANRRTTRAQAGMFERTELKNSRDKE